MEQVEKQREEAQRLGREMEDLQVHLLPPSLIHKYQRTGHSYVLNTSVCVWHLQQACPAVYISAAAKVFSTSSHEPLSRATTSRDFFKLRGLTLAAGAGREGG
jgi:hypothetical protein